MPKTKFAFIDFNQWYDQNDVFKDGKYLIYNLEKTIIFYVGN